MSKYWAWKLKGTILEVDEDKKKDKGGFLDPWSSLIPDYLRKKLSPDVVGIFKNQQTIINGLSEIKSLEMPFWALLFPKRSYLPPDYLHLQLWYLGEKFTPSFQFVSLGQRKVLTGAVKKIAKVYDQILSESNKYSDAKFSLAINATPFSFIKNEQGKYYAGGQSVRTFHLHFLALPQNLEKKKMTEKEAVLVYPTEFSHRLFELVLGKPSVQKFIFNQEVDFDVTERGISYSWVGDLEDLISVIGHLDELMYQVQLSLIYVFYQDSESFLDKLAEFAQTDDLEKMRKELDDLILLGFERSLPITKDLLNKEIHRLGRKFRIEFANSEIDHVVESLTTDETGDLASRVGKEVVVLRPGMGYGTMIQQEDDGYKINIAPLDSLQSEGTMESSGYYFTEKVKVKKKPEWLEEFLSLLK